MGRLSVNVMIVDFGFFNQILVIKNIGVSTAKEQMQH